MLKLALLTAIGLAGLTASAMAADLSIPPAAPAPAATTSWDGGYIGANIGYSWGLADHTSGPGTNDVTLSGFMVGGQVGYNFSLNDQFVVGIEGNADWSNETGTLVVGGPVGTITQTINWDANILAKLGYNAGSFMPYIDGGAAFANSTRTSTGGGLSASNTQIGWTAGVGVEAMLSDNLSAFVSYNYADYGSTTYNTGGIIPTIHLTDNIVKAGLNFHFQ